MTARCRLAVMLTLSVAVAGCQAASETLSHVAKATPGTAGKAAGTAAQIAQQGDTVKGAFADIDEPQEIEIGRAVTAAIGKNYRLVRDRDLTRYVAFVGNAVAARSDRPDLRYYFAVLDSPEVNAFAAPGGFIFVTKGALAVMKDEATLAGVLGHEVGHVALRHGVATIKSQNQKQLVLLAGQVGLSQTSMGAYSGAISAAADTIAEQLVLKGFSRAEESEADKVGFRYAADAGFDATGLRDFLSALLERGSKESAIGKFLSTHPGTEDRLKVQEDLLKTRPTGGRRNPERFARAVTSKLTGAPLPAPPATAAREQPAPAPAPAGRAAVAPAAPVAQPAPRVQVPTTVVAAPAPPQPVPPAVRRSSDFTRAIESSGRYVSYGIHFAVGSDRLSADSTATLKMVADAMQADPSLRLLIEGHTDATGVASRNLDLSRRRAEAVMAALVARFGIAAERLTPIGVGSGRPLDPAATTAAHAANRRVEFVKQ
jgi:outer membrane protein OmpA-like peptidoglycan-associated protein